MTTIVGTVNTALASAGEGPSIVDAAAQRSHSVAFFVIERVKIVRQGRST